MAKLSELKKGTIVDFRGMKYKFHSLYKGDMFFNHVKHGGSLCLRCTNEYLDELKIQPQTITITLTENLEQKDRQLEMIGRLIKVSKGGSVEYSS